MLPISPTSCFSKLKKPDSWSIPSAIKFIRWQWYLRFCLLHTAAIANYGALWCEIEPLPSDHLVVLCSLSYIECSSICYLSYAYSYTHCVQYSDQTEAHSNEANFKQQIFLLMNISIIFFCGPWLVRYYVDVTRAAGSRRKTFSTASTLKATTN